MYHSPVLVGPVFLYVFGPPPTAPQSLFPAHLQNMNASLEVPERHLAYCDPRHDVVPQRTGGVEDQERKPAVTGDQTDVHWGIYESTNSRIFESTFDNQIRQFVNPSIPQFYSSAASSSARRVGRRRMTPRRELRMNSTR